MRIHRVSEDRPIEGGTVIYDFRKVLYTRADPVARACASGENAMCRGTPGMRWRSLAPLQFVRRGRNRYIGGARWKAESDG